jgi:hypothetical protein
LTGFVMAILLSGCIIAAPAGAQAVEPVASAVPVSSDNPAAIYWKGSPIGGEVNFAGSAQPAGVNQLESSIALSGLPTAPSAIAQEQPLRASTPEVARAAMPENGQTAPVYMKRIPAGWVAQPLTARDKMELGVRDLYSPISMLGYVVTAGYEQAVNGQPNFGTNLGAFGQRLGATALRETSEGIFTDAMFAPLLHQDPRYYVEGRQKNFLHRVVYAITRPLITRTDSGRETVNSAELLGYASASALSYTYYPKINQNFHDTAAAFGGAIGGAALGDLVSEFVGDILQGMHMKRIQ